MYKNNIQYVASLDENPDSIVIIQKFWNNAMNFKRTLKVDQKIKNPTQKMMIQTLKQNQKINKARKKKKILEMRDKDNVQS